MKTTRLFSTLVVIAALLLSFVSSPASADTFTTDASLFRSRNTNPNLDKIDPIILDALSAGDPLEDVGFVRSATADFFVWLSDQADLSPATRLATKTDK